MAGYQIPQDAISAHRKTTAAGVADVVTFAGRRTSVEVSNLSSAVDAWLFFTVDGTEATVDGPRTTLVGPGGVVEVEDRTPGNNTIVRLISPVPATYSVTAAAFR